VKGVSITGGKALLRDLKQLPDKLSKKVLRVSMRDASKVILKAVKKEAPKRSGQLRKAIKVRSSKRRKNKIGFRVSMAAGDYKGDAFYGSFIEFGWRSGPRRLGSKRKQQPARGYMQKAFKASAKSATETFTLRARRELALLYR
jgi:HK97 gp10 family phage protein